MSIGYLIIIAVSILLGFISMLSASHNIAVYCYLIHAYLALALNMLTYARQLHSCSLQPKYQCQIFYVLQMSQCFALSK